jgi:hypothetical protein
MKGLARVLAVAVTVVGAWLAPVGASASALPVTITQHNATDTIHDEVPCVGLGDITITFNSVEHFTVNDNGFHSTFTQTGTFAAVLDAGGTSAGRFTIWGGFNTDSTGQNANGTFTFSGTVKSGVGAGTKWNSVSHFTGPVDANGEPIPSLAKVAFDRFRCH